MDRTDSRYSNAARQLSRELTYDQIRVALLLVLLSAAALTDLRTGKVYNWLTYPSALAGLALAQWFGGFAGAAEAMTGLAIGFVPMLVAFALGGSGGGDAKLMAAVGALALPQMTIGILVYGLLVGAAMAMVTMIWKGQVAATLRRIGHVLWLALLGRKGESPSPEAGPQVPLASAIWIGCCWLLIEQRLGTPLWDLLSQRMPF